MSRLDRALILAVVFSGVAATADDYGKLGSFERETVDRIMTDRGMTLDVEPQGKRIGVIHVANNEVFGPADGFLSWFNLFHKVTRNDIVEREVLIRPGVVWDQTLVDESVRNVRKYTKTNIVVILPVRSKTEGIVDLLVVTRDLWSLRLNTDFASEGDRLTHLLLLPGESNFLGYGSQLWAFFNLDQGAFEVGPGYTDPNIFGTHLNLSVFGSALFSRDTGEFEGTRSRTTLTYPLYKLSQSWGGSVQVDHRDAMTRLFQGGELWRWRDLPVTYRQTAVDVDLSASYRWGGSAIKQTLGFGYSVYNNEITLPDEFPQDAELIQAFREEWTPREELSSGPFVSWSLFTPKYRQYRNLGTYDFREDYVLGPRVSWRFSYKPGFLGSSQPHSSVGTSASWAFDPGLESYVKVSAGWSARIQDTELADQSVSATIFGASPVIARAFRVVARLDLDVLLDRARSQPYTLGSGNGLRGHVLSSFRGETRFRGNLELRSTAFSLWFFRIGGVAFYDTGHAADRVQDLRLQHDVGLGLRILIPQVNRDVLRLDVAWDTSGDGVPLVTAGFSQAF